MIPQVLSPVSVNDADTSVERPPKTPCEWLLKCDPLIDEQRHPSYQVVESVIPRQVKDIDRAIASLVHVGDCDGGVCRETAHPEVRGLQKHLGRVAKQINRPEPVALGFETPRLTVSRTGSRAEAGDRVISSVRAMSGMISHPYLANSALKRVARSVAARS